MRHLPLTPLPPTHVCHLTPSLDTSMYLAILSRPCFHTLRPRIWSGYKTFPMTIQSDTTFRWKDTPHHRKTCCAIRFVLLERSIRVIVCVARFQDMFYDPSTFPTFAWHFLQSQNMFYDDIGFLAITGHVFGLQDMADMAWCLASAGLV